mmetsp:Transcript_23127/g.37703  ORF Transcript_23127/g.37703 Transcript_23127/m.37703 type:complete len:274 (-) Transcript_23127:226-1047(-)
MVVMVAGLDSSRVGDLIVRMVGTTVADLEEEEVVVSMIVVAAAADTAMTVVAVVAIRWIYPPDPLGTKTMLQREIHTLRSTKAGCPTCSLPKSARRWYWPPLKHRSLYRVRTRMRPRPDRIKRGARTKKRHVRKQRLRKKPRRPVPPPRRKRPNVSPRLPHWSPSCSTTSSPDPNSGRNCRHGVPNRDPSYQQSKSSSSTSFRKKNSKIRILPVVGPNPTNTEPPSNPWWKTMPRRKCRYSGHSKSIAKRRAFQKSMMNIWSRPCSVPCTSTI